MQPLISIIVPLYNVEDCLARCLESLVNQTLRNIEILLIEDHSEDRTALLAAQYQARYPGMVFLHTNPAKGAASARNYGISLARASYVTFVDSDDHVETWAYEKMVSAAETQNADIVYAPYYHVQGNNVQIRFPVKAADCGRAELLLQNSPNLWNKVFRKSLLDRFGPIPLLRRGEDTAYVYPLLTWAEKVACIQEPYYVYQLREQSISSAKTDDTMAENFSAVFDLMLSTGNPAYRLEMSYLAALRLLDHHHRYWPYGDIFIRHLKEHRETYAYDAFRGCGMKMNSAINKIDALCALPDTPFPCILYAAGFGMEKDNEAVTQTPESAFRDGCRTIRLDESTCDVQANALTQQAYQAKDHRFLNAYFALYKIYEQGGVYVSSMVTLCETLDSLRYDGAFFGYITQDTFTEEIFGGAAGNTTLKAILDTYGSPAYAMAPLSPLNSRIRTIMAGLGAELDGNNCRLPGHTCLYDVSYFVSPREGSRCYASHHITGNAYRKLRALPEKTLLWLSKQKDPGKDKLLAEDNTRLKTELYKVRDEMVNVREELKKARGQRNKYKMELNKVRKSKSFRLGKALLYIPGKIKNLLIRAVKRQYPR